MIVILCDIEDSGALWLHARFRAAGERSILVTSDLLSFARRRSQRIGALGVQSAVDLGEGTVIDRPDLVINRMMSAPDAAWRWARSAEREYATAELTAFTLSWLSGIDAPVRNRPDPSCLAGPAPHPLVAAFAAAACGMDVPDAAFGAHRSPHPLLEAAVREAGRVARVLHVVVLDGYIVDRVGVESRAGQPVPETFEVALRSFVAAVGADASLIGLDIVVADGCWWFAGMSPIADVAVGGDALMRELVALAAPVFA